MAGVSQRSASADVLRAWLCRTAGLRSEIAAVTTLDLRWQLLAAGVALAEVHARPEVYLACDAEPDADTFIGYPSARPHDLVVDAILRANAARTALRELDGTLPDQPLAVTIDHSRGARAHPNTLDVAAFAVGADCVVARLDDPTLPAQLAAALRGEPSPAVWHGEMPFVCVAIGDEPLDTARHGHRRAWTERGGPWLGLGRAGDLAIVSTCHLIIDGYGHAKIAARLAELTAGVRTGSVDGTQVPRLPPVAGAVPLAVAWRTLGCPTPRLLPLAYELGRLLHRQAGRLDAAFSPTIQIPVARGHKDDPARLRRRVVSATTAVQFVDGVPEPFEAFEARVRDVFAREAAGHGLISRLLAAARAIPVPLAWKRASISAKRPPWLDGIAELIGGRALLSRIVVDTPSVPMCAVSSPSRLASAADPIGGCVITIIDDGQHAGITACGSAGSAGSVAELLDALLRAVEGTKRPASSSAETASAGTGDHAPANTVTRSR